MISRLFLFFLLLMAAPMQAPAAGEEHLYRERRGDAHSTFTWKLERWDELLLFAAGNGENLVSHLDPDLSTRRWELVREGEGTAVTIERRGNELHLAGRLRGEPVRRTLPIDSSPCFQALSISLRPFLAGAGDSLEFWMLRPDTLEPVRLRAVKEGEQQVSAAGRSFAAQRVLVHPPGLAALVWRGKYWFRREDGLFLRFEAPGLPGTPPAVVELVR